MEGFIDLFKSPWLITGIAICIIAYITERFPPKSINSLYGYRTKRSMKNQANWDFAQSRSLIYIRLYALLFITIGLLVRIFDIDAYATIFYLIAWTILGAGLLLWLTERDLIKFEKGDFEEEEKP